MRFKLCCCGTNPGSSPHPSPVQPPPGQTTGLPALPGSVVPDVSGAIKTIAVPEKSKENTAPETTLPPVGLESGATPNPGNKETNNPARVYGFATNTDMVSNGRTPLGAWHAVAAKVVAANRFRGAGASSHVGDFRIEELGGKSGHLVFGPVAVFNGNVSLDVKKPMAGMTLTITFTGVAEVDKSLATFLSISHELYSGDFQEGFRTFLFGFNFPHLNLPPTSASPLVHYSFIARLTKTSAIEDDNYSIGSRISEFKSKPLEIVFIPYIDPALEFPPLPRLLPQAFPAKDRNSKGKGVDAAPSPKSVGGAESPTNDSNTGPLKVPKPKLTLTTADFPLTASSNSTPIIDRPRPIDTSVLRTVCMKDDGKTIARLTIELQKTRFLPDDEISVLMQFAIREGDTMPKGFSIRVVEKRCLARMDPDTTRDGAVSDDDEDSLPKLKVIGKERTKVLTGGKFTIHPDNIRNVKPADINIPDRAGSTNAPRGKGEDELAAHRNLLGGKKIEMPIRIRLPSFKTFISDILLPTVALPLGSLSTHDPPPRVGPIDGLPSSSPSSSTHRNNKGKSPMISNTPSPTTTTASSINHSLPLLPSNLGLSFIVAHVLQVTVPTSTSWLKKPTSTSKDLEVSIPIVLGNINPHAALRRKAPDFRMNVLEERMYGAGGSSSSRSSSRKGSVGSVGGYGVASGSGSGGKVTGGWKEGERFLTLKETELRPGFIREF